jgi:hypothetical protein
MIARSRSSRYLLLAMGMASAMPAVAHHSYAAFDRNIAITLKGTVADVEWTNPHTYFIVVAPGPNGGEPIRWTIEGNPPAGMERDGWKKGAAKSGDNIVMVINPLRSGQVGGGHYVSAELPGGVKAGPQGEAAR